MEQELLGIGLEMDVGVRIVRGKDWKWKNQDGGEGGLGTVVEIGSDLDQANCPPDCVMVQWDYGTKNSYRVGYEGAYDLSLYDASPIGVRHPDLTCQACRCNGIFGTVWECAKCPGVSLCSQCYSQDEHEVNHPFKRIDEPGGEGFPVPSREMSKRVKVSGILENATVVRGPSWRWENQDGGPGRAGVVQAVVNFSPDTENNAVEVMWETRIANVYRLGYKGDVDIKCTKPAVGCHYYKHHLRTLRYDDFVKVAGAEGGAAGGSEPSGPGPVEPVRFAAGDKVRIEIDVDVLKMLQETHGGWDNHMVECIGRIGVVFHADKQEVVADFGSSGKWMFHEAALTKVKTLKTGDVVQVSESLSHVRTLQNRRGQWNPKIPQLLGKKGRVKAVEEDGDAVISFGGVTLTFNPDCLTQVSGEPDSVHIPEVEQTSDEPAPQRADTGEPMVNGTLGDSSEENGDTIDTRLKTDPAKEPVKTAQETETVKTGPQRETICSRETHNKDSGNVSGSQSLPQPGSTDRGLSDFVSLDHVTSLSDKVPHRGTTGPERSRIEERNRTEEDLNASEELMKNLFKAIMDKDVDQVKTIVGDNLSMATSFVSGRSPLHVAAYQGLTDVVEFFLTDPNIDIDLTDDERNTPFLAAVKGKQQMIARLFLDKSADIDAINGNDQTALHIAAQNQDIACLQMLLERGCNINAEDRLGDSALIDAIQTGNEQCIQLLVQQDDINLDSTNFMGFSAIHFAARKGEKMAVEKILKKSPDALNRPKPDDYTPLHLAACNDHYEITHFLLTQPGIKVDFRSSSQQTPIMLACCEGYFEIVKLLVENHADTSLVDEDGNNCLHLALTGKSSILEMKQSLSLSPSDETLEEESGRVKIATYLIQHDVPFEERNVDGKTPLEVCTSDRVKETVLQFIKSFTGDSKVDDQASGWKIPSSSQSDDGTSGSEQEEYQILLQPCEHYVAMSMRSSEKTKFCPECGQRILSRQTVTR